MRIAWWTLLVVLALAPLASAHDLLPPSWRGQPGTSTLVYDNSWIGYDYFNDYGGGLAPPQIHYETGWGYWNGGQLGMPGYGWYLPWANRNSRLVFEMDDYDSGQLYKDIRVQVTFYAPDFYDYYEPWRLGVWATSNVAWDDPNFSWDSSNGLFYSGATYVPGYGDWHCAAFDLRLSPNPDSEVIGLDFGAYGWPWWYTTTGDWLYPYGGGGYMYIDQVVIDTRCSSIPEPSVACLLLALGGTVALLGRRRRKA